MLTVVSDSADRDGSGARIGLAGGEERGVGTALGDARQNAGGVAEQRLRPEIGAGRHQEKLRQGRGGISRMRALVRQRRS